MKKKGLFKRGFAAFLAAVLVATGIPEIEASAVGANPSFDSKGQYALELKNDGVTPVPYSSSETGGFGDRASDGRVWTDKSVTVSDTGDSFDVTLRALAQEYVKTDTSSGSAEGPAADVMLILDITSSMKRGINSSYNASTKNRSQAMADAANKAIDIIMKANPKNRISITVYGNEKLAESTMKWIPLGSLGLTSGHTYTGGNTQFGENDPSYNGIGKYIEYNYSDHKFTTSAGLLWNGADTYKSKSVSPDGSGTYTQRGIYTGMNWMKEQISAETKGVDDKDRFPYVLILTDGAANKANTDWKGTSFTSYSSSQTDASYAGYTILTAAYQKQILKAAYNTYNGTSDMDVTVFTIGLGPEVTDHFLQMLDPSTITSSSKLNESTYNGYAGTENDYKTTSPTKYYLYPTQKEDGTGFFCYTATAMDALNGAFTELADLVSAKTASTTNPITSYSEGDPAANIEFVDKLGEGMKLIGGIKMGATAGTPSTSGNVTTYTFGSMKSTATYDSSSNTVKWILNAEELPIITFKKSTAPDEGFKNPTEAPVALYYNVCLDTSASPLNLTKSAYYSNDGTEGLVYSRFKPTSDNPYYIDVDPTDSTNNTKKTTLSGDKNKSANNTDTLAYISKVAWDGDYVKTGLGNNGKEGVIASIEKTVDKASYKIGDTLTYTITVKTTDFTTADYITVKDTVSDSLEILSVTPAETARDGQKLQWKLENVAKNETKTITVSCKVKSGAGDNISNTASISEVKVPDGTKSFPDDESPKATVESSITANGKAEITLNKDDEIWEGKSITLIDKDDPTKTFTLTYNDTTGKYEGDVPGGRTYKVSIDGNELPSTYNMTVPKGDTKSQTIDYYTLTLNKDSGFSAVTGGGVYLKGTNVNISATLKSDSEWDEWESSTTGVSDISIQNTSITVDRTITLKAKSNLQTVPVSVPIRLDDITGYGDAVKLVDVSGNEIPLSKDPVTGNFVGDIPNGEYRLIVNGSFSGKTITIENNALATPISPIDYYTLTLTGDKGISDTIGAGVYPAGTEVDISALLKKGYKFVGWTSLIDGVANLTDANTTIILDRHMSFNAVSKKKSGKPAGPTPPDAPTPAPDEPDIQGPIKLAAKDVVPKTGDDFYYGFYILLIVIGIVGLGSGYILLSNSKQKL